MSVRCLWIFIALAACSVSQVSRAEEVAGKLERVDYETVTIIASDNRKVNVRVDAGNRQKAAPFLGKTVTVDVVNMDKGECRAKHFRPAQ
jgi:ribosome maturation factor RimP